MNEEVKCILSDYPGLTFNNDYIVTGENKISYRIIDDYGYEKWVIKTVFKI